MVRHLDLGDVQALPNMGSSGRTHDHGFETGRHIHLQLFNGHQMGAVLIAPGEVADQIPEGEDIQIDKLLGPGRAHAF